MEKNYNGFDTGSFQRKKPINLNHKIRHSSNKFVKSSEGKTKCLSSVDCTFFSEESCPTKSVKGESDYSPSKRKTNNVTNFPQPNPLPKEESTSFRIKSFDRISRDEIYSILKLRQDVFIIEKQITYEDIDSKDADSIHMWCQGPSIEDFYSYLRIVPIPEKSEVSIGRVLTSQKERGKGMARQLMKSAIEFVLSNFPGYSLILSAKEELCPFYETLGFEKKGPRFFFPENDTTPIFPMIYSVHLTESKRKRGLL